MRNVLVIGELNAIMQKTVSHIQYLAQYHFEFFNMTNSIYIDQEPDSLDKVYAAIKRNDIIVFSKKDSELCLKMTLAAMQICNNEHLIVLEERNNSIDSSRLQSLLRVSDVGFSVIQFKSTDKDTSMICNIIQNKSVLTDLKLEEKDFFDIFKALLSNIYTPLLEFSP